MPKASNEAIREGYERAQAFTKRRSSSFYYPFAVLPREKRNAVYAAYSFAGTADDAVDEAGTDDERRQRLVEAGRVLDRAYAGDADDWIAAALGDAVQRYAIPREHFDELVSGMEQDLTQTRYATWDELNGYCYRAASVIGLITIAIFGYDQSQWDRVQESAIDMGKALQITNIMRDVQEDAERGRIYLAQEDLESFGVSEDDLKANRLSDEFRALMREYGQRARVLYASGERLIPLLDGARSRACCNGLNGGYRTILDAIEDRDYDVFSSRVRPSKPAALLTLGRLWLAGAGSGLSPGDVMRR
jgi:phytoene synthase